MPPRNATPAQRRQPFVDRLWLGALPLIVAALTAVAGWVGADWLDRQVQQRADQDFQRMLVRVSKEVTDRFRRPVYGLNGLRAGLGRRGDLASAEFAAYVQSLAMEADFAGVRGFGYVQAVARSDTDALVARLRASGQPDYVVREIGPDTPATRYLIRQVEPASRNPGALGLDLATEPVRRAAIEYALGSEEAVSSGAIKLVQAQKNQVGILLVLALRGAGSAADPLQRAVTGLVYAPVVVDELLAGIDDVESGQASVTLLDSAGGLSREGGLLFQAGPTPAASNDASAAAPAMRQATTLVSLPGRPVTLAVRSTPGFEAHHATSAPALVRGASMLAGLLLGGLLWQQAMGRLRAERRAQTMTAEMQRLSLVARRTSNAVIITDAQRRITWVNDGFERSTGYSAGEVVGRIRSEMLQAAEVDAQTLTAMRRSLDAGQAFSAEVHSRGKTGQPYWMHIEIQPLHDEAGALTGFMAIEQDITARKDAELALARERQSLQNIIEGTRAGTWEWDVETGETRFNERWAQITGYTLSDLGATSIDTWTHLAHPDDMRQTSVLLEQHFDGLNETFESEARMRHLQGHWVWVQDRGKLFSRNADGRPRWMAGTRLDITQRKHAEAALRDSQEFMDRTGRLGGVGGWERDLLSPQVRWTDQTCRILGYPAGYLPTLAEALATYDLGARDEFARVTQGAIEAGQSFDTVLPFIRIDGVRILCRVVGQAEFEDGQAVRLFGMLQDVTERQQVQAAAERNAALLEGAIGAIDEAFVLYDPDDRLVMCNERYRQLYAGVADLIVPGVRFEDLVRAGAERGDYAEAVGRVDAWVRERVIAHQAANRTVIQPLSNGRTLRIVERKLPDGHLVGFRIDITELAQAREQAEAASRASAQALARLQAIYDILPVGITITDPQGHIIDCNPASERMLGITKAEHLARDYAGKEWTILREDGSPMPVSEFASVRALQTRQPVHDAPMQVLTPQGSVWLSVSAMPAAHEDLGVVIGYVDITEQRAQQAALAMAVDQAEAASVAKSQFLANMSHEIRTPMNAILGMLALLRKTALTPRQADYADKTAGAARSLLGLLNDILDFSKVEAGKMTLDLQPFRIDRLMRDLGVILSANLGAKPVEVLFQIDPALPRDLVGDAMRLQQVLINLAGNAVKFTARGEVVVSVRVAQRAADKVRLRFAVRDTGIGIAPENLGRIFSGFTQAEASTTRRYGGTGLGVAISQRLVGLMGGQLRVDSALGAGSTFHFEIALSVLTTGGGSAIDAEVKGETGTDAGAGIAPRRALIVDDNASARETLNEMCSALGWQCDTVASGTAALDLLGAGGVPYDAVFLDWQMPGLDGWQTAEQIRRHDLAPGAPLVVMVTAHGRDRLEQRSAADQALLDGYLVKPITASMLQDAVVNARQGWAVSGVSKATLEPGASPRRLPGLRLLLVEDNLNNQQVARELLEDEGAQVQIASDGQAGLDAVAANPHGFDLVLMDLQMPVMDGLTASRCIRNDLGLAQLPIVAMTANAMVSDREACLAAGMNDHVGKPIDLDALVAVILRHCQWTLPVEATSLRAPQRQALSPDARHADPTKHLDLPEPARLAAQAAGVALGAALQRINGKQAAYVRMLGGFVQTLQALPAQWAESLRPDDPAAPGRLLHTLKGLSATVGAQALAVQFAEAEAALAIDPAQGPALGGSLLAVVATHLPALQQLQQVLTDPPASPTLGLWGPVAADLAALRAGLDELAPLLAAGDMSAIERLPGLLQQAGSTHAAQVKALGDAVEGLDFDLAVPLCQQLMRALAP